MQKKHIVLYIICAACALTCVGAAAFNVVSRTRAMASYAALEEEVVTLRDPVEEKKPAENAGEEKTREEKEEKKEENEYAWDGKGAELEIDFKALLKKNDDTVAWLHVPAVGISYPVLYYPYDNDYYLNRSFDGSYSSAGVIYLEHTNKPDFSEMNSFMYGHNMGDGSMFGSLHKIAQDEKKLEKNPDFYLYFPDGSIRKYLIFSFYDTYTGSSTYFVPEKEKAYDDYAKMVAKMSLTEVKTSFKKRPPLVTMSTCHGAAGTTRRFVVHGALSGIYTPGDKK